MSREEILSKFPRRSRPGNVSATCRPMVRKPQSSHRLVQQPHPWLRGEHSGVCTSGPSDWQRDDQPIGKTLTRLVCADRLHQGMCDKEARPPARRWSCDARPAANAVRSSASPAGTACRGSSQRSSRFVASARVVRVALLSEGARNVPVGSNWPIAGGFLRTSTDVCRGRDECCRREHCGDEISRLFVRSPAGHRGRFGLAWSANQCRAFD